MPKRAAIQRRPVTTPAQRAAEFVELRHHDPLTLEAIRRALRRGGVTAFQTQVAGEQVIRVLGLHAPNARRIERQTLERQPKFRSLPFDDRRRLVADHRGLIVAIANDIGATHEAVRRVLYSQTQSRRIAEALDRAISALRPSSTPQV